MCNVKEINFTKYEEFNIEFNLRFKRHICLKINKQSECVPTKCRNKLYKKYNAESTVSIVHSLDYYLILNLTSKDITVSI